MPGVITTIPATIGRFTATPINQNTKRKVAGYARVSTDKEDQATSYEAQVNYYTNYIKSRDDWEFAGLYSDEGISATSIKHREGFKKMINDALAGKIQLIVTKSVSRFARNTVDSLSTIRKLKEHGVEVYFEKENIWTLEATGELLITVLSSLSQEEARSISENVTWGQRRRFAEGKVSIPFGSFLGYDRGEDGNLVINSEQAETVKLIYSLFLSGLSYKAIARELTNRGIKTARGKDKWYGRTICSILTNEKMKGDALLQKNFTVDFLTKKQVKNNGQIPQYYVTGNHEPIISPETFDLVQAEIARRKGLHGHYSGVSIFSCKIKCGECGGWFGAKVWHSTDKYRRVIYQCNNKFAKKCETPHLSEDEIKQIFINAFNRLFADKDNLLEDLKKVKSDICDIGEVEKEKNKYADEMAKIADLTQKCINENARVAQNQAEYQKRYNGLVQKYDAAKLKYDDAVQQIESRRAKSRILDNFIKTLKTQDSVLEEFDEGLWSMTVDYVTVYGKDDIGVMFKNGVEIR